MSQLDRAKIYENYGAMSAAICELSVAKPAYRTQLLRHYAADDYPFHEEVLTALCYRLNPRMDYHITVQDLFKEVLSQEVKHHYNCVFDLLDALASLPSVTDADICTVQTFLRENPAYEHFLRDMILKTPFGITAEEVNAALGREAIPC